MVPKLLAPESRDGRRIIGILTTIIFVAVLLGKLRHDVRQIRHDIATEAPLAEEAQLRIAFDSFMQILTPRRYGRGGKPRFAFKLIHLADKKGYFIASTGEKGDATVCGQLQQHLIGRAGTGVAEKQVYLSHPMREAEQLRVIFYSLAQRLNPSRIPCPICLNLLCCGRLPAKQRLERYSERAHIAGLGL